MLTTTERELSLDCISIAADGATIVVRNKDAVSDMTLTIGVNIVAKLLRMAGWTCTPPPEKPVESKS